MQLKKLLVLIVAISLFLPLLDANAQSDVRSGNSWMVFCEKYGTDPVIDQMCVLYTEGVADGLQYGSASINYRDKSSVDPIFCASTVDPSVKTIMHRV